MALNSLHDLFVDEIRDLYSAEKQLVAALPKMAKAATNSELRAGFEAHLEETKMQVERLEEIFDVLGLNARAKHCEAMEGLIKEGKEIIEEDGNDEVKDAALIVAAQKVEHYEIASYGAARAHAELLGLSRAVELLEVTLEEEKATDTTLNELAVGIVNMEADTFNS